jgi:hypothetical protein
MNSLDLFKDLVLEVFNHKTEEMKLDLNSESEKGFLNY